MRDFLDSGGFPILLEKKTSQRETYQMALCSHYTLPTAVTASCVCSPVTRPQPEPHGQTSVSPEWLRSHDLTKSPNVGGSRSSFESSWSQCRRMQVSGKIIWKKSSSEILRWNFSKTGSFWPFWRPQSSTRPWKGPRSSTVCASIYKQLPAKPKCID